MAPVILFFLIVVLALNVRTLRDCSRAWGYEASLKLFIAQVSLMFGLPLGSGLFMLYTSTDKFAMLGAVVVGVCVSACGVVVMSALNIFVMLRASRVHERQHVMTDADVPVQYQEALVFE